MPRQKSKKETKKFTIDCSIPKEDGILPVDAFTTFLQQRIKVNGKAGELGDVVSVSLDDSKIVVTANISNDNTFSKRYLKYLTKKFLKKNNLRDWIRVVASTPVSYELKYYSIRDEEEEDSE
uniref:Large ribosomal subunit protein eL22 n=2 Tax=Palpitomonas bilix TaxID=652834 RepID=A0A7S3DBY1_9EUKA|mmetsp:Transcript_30957/g.81317  ORF Transcript_30957/g.81317 Transcript_30957/m.81317 type:complete len:122 (+) Transcript_30957:242-607(+)